MHKSKAKNGKASRNKALAPKKNDINEFYSRLGLTGTMRAAQLDNYFYERVPTYTTTCAGV